MKQYNLCVVLVSLMPPSPAVLLADPQWTSSDEHTCSRMKMTSLEALLGVWEGPAPPALTSNWQWNTLSSLEFSPSCHHVARWRWKAWCLDTRGFISKKIQWHIHAGPWSLVNWWHEVLTRHYIRCSWILMRVAVSLMEWPRPWWWSVYPRDTPTGKEYVILWI